MEIGEEGELSRPTAKYRTLIQCFTLEHTTENSLSPPSSQSAGSLHHRPRQEGRQSSLVRPPGVNSPNCRTARQRQDETRHRRALLNLETSRLTFGDSPTSVFARNLRAQSNRVTAHLSFRRERLARRLRHLTPSSQRESMDMELPALSSSQESVGKLFDSNLPSNYCYGFFQECGVGEFGEGGEATDYERELQEAEKQAMESGSITPLVKQELKLVIQSRRLSQGKDELRVGFVQPASHQVKN